MVNTLPLSLYPELKDVDPSLIDDEVIAQVEAERAAIARTQRRVSIIAELYREFEKDNLDTINYLHIECGVMRSLIERFPGDNIMRQWAEYFIRLNGVEIENLVEEIRYDRRTTRELEGV